MDDTEFWICSWNVQTATHVLVFVYLIIDFERYFGTIAFYIQSHGSYNLTYAVLELFDF